MASEAVQQVLDLLASDAPFEQKLSAARSAFHGGHHAELAESFDFKCWLLRHTNEIKAVEAKERAQP